MLWSMKASVEHLFGGDTRYSPVPYAQPFQKPRFLSGHYSCPHKRRLGVKHFQIRALVTRYVVPLDNFTEPRKSKEKMISFRQSLQSKPPATILKLVQLVIPLQSLLPGAPAAQKKKRPAAAETVSAKKPVKLKRTQPLERKGAGVKERNRHDPEKRDNGQP